MVPIMVAMIEDVKAMVSVLPAASITSSFLASSQNQWKGPHLADVTRLPSITVRSLNPGIKPSKVTLARDALNEYRVRTTIGAYKKMYTSTAAILIKGCRRYGFISRPPAAAELKGA